MGKIKRGILGGFVGKVGNVVGSSWKGIETMRALPISVLNPRTTAQVGNRTRFGSLSTLAAAMLTTIVKPLNDRFASGMSGYNAFTARNKTAFTDDGIFVPANLVLSTGKLGDTDITSITHVDATLVQVEWDATPVGSYQMLTDKAYIAVVGANGVVGGTISGSIERSAGEAYVTIPEGLSDAGELQVYLSFLRADGTIVGNSTHGVTA